MTANCAPVLSPDHQATNGIVHVVDRVLEPVEDTLHDVITDHPQLSMFRKCKY